MLNASKFERLIFQMKRAYKTVSLQRSSLMMDGVGVVIYKKVKSQRSTKSFIMWNSIQELELYK